MGQSAMEELLTLLREWRTSLPDGLDGVYIFGSAVQNDGLNFAPQRSDIDLLMVMAQGLNADQRTSLACSLVDLIHKLEIELLQLFSRRNADEPIVSTLLVCREEVDCQIHKGGDPRFFADNRFVSLSTTASEQVSFDSWTEAPTPDEAMQVVRAVQKERNAFLGVSANRRRSVKCWDDTDRSIPKALARSAALLRFASQSGSVSPAQKTDLGEGQTHFIHLIPQEGKAFERLRSKMMSRASGFRNVGLTIEETVLSWEILATAAYALLQAKSPIKSGQASGGDGRSITLLEMPPSKELYARAKTQTLLVHFLDHHFLASLRAGRKAAVRETVSEARLALRIGLCVSDSLLVPASSFVESSICRRLVLELKSLWPSGRVRLVGGGLSFPDYCERALLQYRPDSEHARLYREAQLASAPPFQFREESATAFIAEYWLSSHVNLARDRIYRTAGSLGLKIADAQWESLPSDVEDQAFIVENIAPTLLGLKGDAEVPKPLSAELHTPINQAYFLSFCKEFGCGGFSDLIYLGSPLKYPPEIICVSYRRAIRALQRERGALDLLIGMNAAEFDRPDRTVLISSVLQDAVSASNAGRHTGGQK